MDGAAVDGSTSSGGLPADTPAGAPDAAGPAECAPDPVPAPDGSGLAPDGSGPAPDGSGLGERDRAILRFERQWWKYAGAKENAIRAQFEMSATRYYQVLNTLVDTPGALAADPMLVKRLRRLRSSRQKQRAARRVGAGTR